MTLIRTDRLKRGAATILTAGMFLCLVASYALANAAEPALFKHTVRGQGPDLVLIPGLMSDGRIWEETARHLEKKYQVHVIELLGFGRNPSNGPYSFDQLMAQLTSYLSDLEHPVLVGHSLGGFLAMSIALEQPGTIAKIVSVDGLPFIGPVFTGSAATGVADLAPQAAYVEKHVTSLSREQFDAQLQQDLARQASDTESQALVFEMSRQSSPEIAGSFMSTLMTRDLRESISALDCPILLLGASGGFAEHDAKQRVKAIFQQQLEQAPNGRVVMHTQARHFIMLDDGQWLPKRINEFLDEA